MLLRRSSRGLHFIQLPTVGFTAALQLACLPRSWTAFANLLFLDTPAPTGFSAAAGTAAGAVDGASSTAATLAALQAFYAKFPGTQKQRLFLAGQGYAGAGQLFHCCYVCLLPASPGALCPDPHCLVSLLLVIGKPLLSARLCAPPLAPPLALPDAPPPHLLQAILCRCWPRRSWSTMPRQPMQAPGSRSRASLWGIPG